MEMFPHLTEAVVKKLGSNGGLISNDALNKKWEILTLVKIGTNSNFSYFYPRPKYTCYDLKLGDIIDENIRLDYNKEVLVEDFKNVSLDNVSIEAGGDVVGGQGKASGKNEESSSSATLMSEGIMQQDLAELIMRPQEIKLKMGIEKKFKLMKGEKLAFVKQNVYNTRCVKFKSKTSKSWSLAATIYSFLAGSSEVEKTEVTTFTVPENKVFAFALKQITLEDGCLAIHPESGLMGYRIKSSRLRFSYSQKKAAPFISVVIDDINNKVKVLEPLAGVSGPTRAELLKKLTEILEDGKALALLGETLDQVAHGEYQRPPSETVASFMDLLDVPNISKDLMEALHLLVSALEALADSAAALLIHAGPETLNCIRNMINDLKDGQARLPESAPRPLQENQELHWVAQFIMSANDLEALKKTWRYPLFSAEGLLELLYVSVGGLRLMQ